MLSWYCSQLPFIIIIIIIDDDISDGKQTGYWLDDWGGLGSLQRHVFSSLIRETGSLIYLPSAVSNGHMGFTTGVKAARSWN
jgi:hypothetical protein